MTRRLRTTAVWGGVWALCSFAIWYVLWEVAFSRGPLRSSPSTTVVPIRVTARNGNGVVSLQYVLQNQMRVGDSLPVLLIIRNQNLIVPSGSTIEARLDVPDNCEGRSAMPAIEPMPKPDMAVAFQWTVTAKVEGQCLLTFATTFRGGFVQSGAFTPQLFQNEEVTIQGRRDLEQKLQPYVVALIGASGVVLGALITRRS